MAPPTRARSITPRRCGAITLADGSVTWRVWAPLARQVELVLMGAGGRRVRPLGREEGGYFSISQPQVPEGQRYAFRLDGGEDRPDPCSLWQPEGVAGPSAVVRPERFEWHDSDWGGIPRDRLVFYELHVGTFTDDGTFSAIVPRLDSLRELGVTALEIMPVGQFPGTRNWGYDGVLPYATQDSYGGPYELYELVDACHAHGIAVFLDVVYNHFGPEGNYLAEFGPYFTDRYKTPWGRAVNYDDQGCDAVRDFVLDNARMWLEEFHFDGLRLDAVHAIHDLGARHILSAIEDVAQDVQACTGRLTHIVAESDLNDPRLLLPPQRGGYGIDAQWSDDFHHAVHALLTGEQRGYYRDFGRREQLARVFQSPFLYAGDYSPHRGRKHGAPPEGLSGDRFVVCIQNHDQVGNRALGDRLSTLLDSPVHQRLAASLLLFSPHLPLLFMGEEYGERNPFPFFCSFRGEELVRAVREGRRREFSDFLAHVEELPDPHDPATFASAKLSWAWPEGTTHAGLRRLYTDLLKSRREWPALADFEDRSARLLPGDQPEAVLELIRGDRNGRHVQAVHIYFNLTDRPQPIGETLSDGTQPMLFTSESPRYGGTRAQWAAHSRLLPFECIAFGPNP